jgi:hypothetical protein
MNALPNVPTALTPLERARADLFSSCVAMIQHPSHTRLDELVAFADSYQKEYVAVLQGSFPMLELDLREKE